ncbi:MAG: alpha/beta hydrolase [Verrucomicrobiota bacterium]
MIGPRKISHVDYPQQAEERVIVLGGIGPNFLCMRRMATYLQEQGYAVTMIHYPSTRHALEPLVRDHVAPAVAQANTEPDQPLHFVTLSMGGIVFRQLLACARPANLGRAVLVAPPNGGSEVADFFREWALFRWLFGPAGPELGTRPSDRPKALGPINGAEVGVIAGTRSIDPWFDPMFGRQHRGAHDGKVTVASARMEGLADFLTLQDNHYTIIRSPETLRQTTYFLRSGHFEHES